MENWLKNARSWIESTNWFFFSSTNGPSGHWFYDYQAIWGGAIAAAASAIAVWGVYQLQSRQLFLKNRSKLSIALLDLGDYADSCLWKLKCGLDSISDGPAYVLETSKIPDSALEVIAELSALTPERDALMLRRLMESVQIQHSRLFSNLLQARTSTGALDIDEFDIEQRVLETAALSLMINHLYDYARWKTKHIPPFDQNKEIGALQFILSIHFPTDLKDNVVAKVSKLAQRQFHEPRT